MFEECALNPTTLRDSVNIGFLASEVEVVVCCWPAHLGGLIYRRTWLGLDRLVERLAAHGLSVSSTLVVRAAQGGDFVG